VEPIVQELEPGVFSIDLVFRDAPQAILVYLIASREGLTLIETGPASTIDALRAGIAAAGFAFEQVTQLVVTHIHLDHAGAAGALLAALPNARLFVHRLGAPHMIDPTRLLASAGRIYGDQLIPLWGETLPCPAERVIPLDDGDLIDAGSRTLRAVATPGHASHHHAFHDVTSGAVYTGDVAGIRINSRPFVFPPTPPPDVDLGHWRQSITRLRALRPSRLYLTHGGPVYDPDWHFDDLLARLFLWSGLVGARLQAGDTPEAITEMLMQLGEAEFFTTCGDASTQPAYRWASGGYRMSVDGLVRYFRRHAPSASGLLRADDVPGAANQAASSS